MPDAGPPPEWLEAANRLATVARQLVTVVHETNNLLQVISGNAEMLELGGELSERGARRAQTIAEHARRASALLADVLAFSRDPDVTLTRVDADELARSAVALRQYAATKARVAVEIVSDGAAPAVANRRRTLQVLLNLLINAEQAVAGRDDPRVRVTVAREADAIAVRVEDNGRGWSAADAHPRPFAAPVAAPGTPPPLGIGLRVAEWLAREQGGSLVVEADAASGGAVTLRLPLA